MARASSNFRPGVLLLALAIAVFLWGVAQGSTSIRYSFDIPVEIHGVRDTLVVTDQSADAINVGVMGSRAALRNLDEARLKYAVDVSSAKSGVAEFEVELAHIELPRRARFVNHSPTRIQIRLERRSRKEVSVVADVQGEPAAGFELAEVRVVPGRVWLAGAHSHVMRVAEVQTEPIEIGDLQESVEREARLILGGGTVWMEDEKPVTVQLVIEPVAEPPETETLLDAPLGAAAVAPAAVGVSNPEEAPK
jgi:YbbR domain-containing protein